MAPRIEESTPEQRRAYVESEWRCTHNCEWCGKCAILKGRDVEAIYADYFDGKRSYMTVTQELRESNYYRNI